MSEVVVEEVKVGQEASVRGGKSQMRKEDEWLSKVLEEEVSPHI